jgi:hypothetical protein
MSDEAEGCPACRGTGHTRARYILERLVSCLLIAGADDANKDRPRAQPGRPHPNLDGMALHLPAGPHEPPDVVWSGTGMAELTTGLAGRPPSGMGHDAIDRWNSTDKIVRAAGLDPATWGICPACKGDPDGLLQESAPTTPPEPT